jgi:hypothetical protein
MFYIINPKCLNIIYDNEDFDIELLKFKTKKISKYIFK